MPAQPPNEDQKKLTILANRAHEALISVTTVFPFKFFPSTITIDRTKITVNEHFFFFSRQVQSVLVKDLMSLVVQMDLFFATVHIIDRLFPQDTIIVRFLPKDAARKVRWITQGLIAIQKEEIDSNNISTEELLSKAQMIGQNNEL